MVLGRKVFKQDAIWLHNSHDAILRRARIDPDGSRQWTGNEGVLNVVRRDKARLGEFDEILGAINDVQFFVLLVVLDNVTWQEGRVLAGK